MAVSLAKASDSVPFGDLIVVTRVPLYNVPVPSLPVPDADHKAHDADGYAVGE